VARGSIRTGYAWPFTFKVTGIVPGIAWPSELVLSFASVIAAEMASGATQSRPWQLPPLLYGKEMISGSTSLAKTSVLLCLLVDSQVPPPDGPLGCRNHSTSGDV
jgi:hypothetical protein